MTGNLSWQQSLGRTQAAQPHARICKVFAAYMAMARNPCPPANGHK